MEVALRSDFPWGRARKAGLRACSADWVQSECFWHGEEGCDSVRTCSLQEEIQSIDTGRKNWSWERERAYKGVLKRKFSKRYIFCSLKDISDFNGSFPEQCTAPFLALPWPWNPPSAHWYHGLPVDVFYIKKNLSFNVSLHSETPRRYAYLSIFSYKDLWNWNRTTAVFCRAARNWEAFEKLGFEVLTSSLQGLPQLRFLHVLMAWTAGIFKNRFQGVSLLLCIADYF